MSTDLVRVSNAVSNSNTGKDFAQDSWTTMWTTVNWGDLLSPAPLSIALLGSVCVIASSTDDFSLIVKQVEGDKNPLVEWKYAQYPGSFKTCLQQMVAEGYTAFETAQKSMTIIQNRSSGMPKNIQNAVNVVFNGSPHEVEAFVPDLIQSVLDSADACKVAAEQTERSFEGLTGLAQEMVLACTNKIGNSEQILVQNNTHYEILKIQREGDERVLKQRQETHDMFKGSFKNVDEVFHQAVRDMPSGWDVVGMGVVDSLTQLAVSAGNAAISVFTLKSQVAAASLGAFNSAMGNNPDRVQLPTAPVNSSPNGISTLPNDNSLTDPALLETPKILQLANALQQLISGGEGGKPDWDKIRSKEPSSPSGANYIKFSLQSSEKNLDKSKNISAQLDVYINSGLVIANAVIEIAGSAGATDTALDSQKESTKQLVQNLQMLDQTCNILLQQPGPAPKGPATPTPPSNISKNSAQLAVENAKYKVDVTRSSLDASRKSVEEAGDRLVDAQKKMTATIAEITQISMDKATLQTMLPVLRKAVTTFTILRAQFSKITEFFVNVASLVRDVMGPSVGDWAKALDNTTTKLAGVSLSSLAKQIIYIQMMVPLKVSILCEKISTTYLKVSQQYIMPAQRTVGDMIQFPDEAGSEALLAKLRKAQKALKQQALGAADGILALVKSDQRTFIQSIQTRLTAITDTVKPALPTVDQPSAPVKAITDAHTEDKKAYDDKYNMGDYF